MITKLLEMSGQF